MAQTTKSKTLLSVAIGTQHGLIPEEETVRIAAASNDDTKRHSVLVLALEHAFDPERDRIIYEADPSAASAVYSECTAAIIKPVGSGLSAALGFAAARDRLQQKHCVVLIAQATSIHTVLEQPDRSGGDNLARCVIVAPTSSDQLVGQGGPALRRFEARGGQVLNLTQTRNLLELSAGLRSASNRLAPCLVLIDPAIAPVWQMQTESRDVQTAPLVKESIAERVLQSSLFREIARFTRDERRATPVLFSSERPWESRLLEEFGSRVLLLEDEDVGESLPWCGALAQGGCQPIVVLNADQFAKHVDALRTQIFALEQRTTVIVLDAVTDTVSSLQSVLTPVMADVPLVLPGTPDEAIPLARAALHADGPRLLYWPLISVLYSAERDRWLDFRAAAGLRERAGKQAPPVTLPLMLGPRERESRLIQGLQLTPDMERWVNEYVGVAECDPEEWRRASHAIQLLELPSVVPGWRRRNRETKFLVAMFHRLLEHLTEEPDGDQLLRRFMRLGQRPDVSATDACGPCSALAIAVWDEVWRRAEHTPRYREFADLLCYDFRQLCNTVEYTDLVLRQPELNNAVEHAMYSVQGMLVTSAATLDLMCSPEFDANELGSLREAVWHAACMAMYSDLTATRRPRNGALGPTVRHEFFNQWQIHRAGLLNLRERVPSCSLRAYVEGLDRLLAARHAATDTSGESLNGGR